MSAGDLRDYVVFRSATYTKDAQGGLVRGISPLYSCWGSIQSQVSSEQFVNDERGSQDDLRIVVRACYEVQLIKEKDVAEVTPSYSGDAVTYEVNSIAPLDYRRDWVLIGLVLPRNNEAVT